MEDATTKSYKDNLFDLLPEEIYFKIFEYMDVSSLGKLSCISKGIISKVVSNERVWGQLVRKRFLIEPSKSRPNVYSSGRNTWKSTYRLLSSCNRIPKCRLTNKKIIFAKSSIKCDNGTSIWVLLGHTPNCETRICRQRSRHIVFYVCIQNVRSGFSTVNVDVGRMNIQFLEDGSTRHQFLKACSVPQIIYGSTDFLNESICLKPFDFAIFKVTFPCPSNVIYETDFLARAVSLQVPIQNSSHRLFQNAATPADKICGDSSKSTAFFLTEKQIWDNYMLLPGGCLVLSEKTFM